MTKRLKYWYSGDEGDSPDADETKTPLTVFADAYGIRTTDDGPVLALDAITPGSRRSPESGSHCVA